MEELVVVLKQNIFLKNIKLQKNYSLWLLIRDFGTLYQTYIRLKPAKKELFHEFVKTAYQTHDENREYESGCSSNSPNLYKIKKGIKYLELKPTHQSDSIFNLLIEGFPYY